MTGILVLTLRVLLAVALYAFVGWAVYVLWQTLAHNEAARRQNKIPALSLFSDRPPQPQEYHFKQSEVNIGRSPTSDCIIDADTVSLRHARLVYRQNQWWIEDLRSTNGTFMNGDAVTVPAVVTTGDILTFGNVDYLVAISQSK